MATLKGEEQKETTRPAYTSTIYCRRIQGVIVSCEHIMGMIQKTDLILKVHSLLLSLPSHSEGLGS